MITEKQFLDLTKEQKERILTALFDASHPGVSFTKTSFDITVPEGYNVHISSFLVYELQREVVKKIFVLLQDFNDFITPSDIKEVQHYVDQLMKTGKFVQGRDDFWLVVNEKWTYQAYYYARGKIALAGPKDIIQGLTKFYPKSRELRDICRHYGLML